MARLVGVCRSDDYPFERRQLPLTVDQNLTMVVQFSDTCLGCEHAGIKQKDLERFVQKFGALSKDELAVALLVTNKELCGLLSQLVPCVGCRNSVERLFEQLVQSMHPALEPLVITPQSELSISRTHLFDAKAIYALFYIHGSKLGNVMNAIPVSKKNRRCVLHSLDTHKTRSLGSWMDVWDVLSQDCRDEVVLVDCEDFIDTLDNYLRKHRFCTECKAKVLRAYHILTGDQDCTVEKGYCPALYHGLKFCAGERHIHVDCKTDFIAHLITRAEPELTGRYSRRERHAKTLDIAQEEVLTCLGIHLYERLHRIWQKLRAEEQTWQILLYVGVIALRKNFELALEKKQGVSNLELMCEELLEEERAKEQKREQKRQKRRKKKNKAKKEADEQQGCQCDVNTNVLSTSCATKNLMNGDTSTCRCDNQPIQPSKGSRDWRGAKFTCSGDTVGGGLRGGGCRTAGPVRGCQGDDVVRGYKGHDVVRGCGSEGSARDGCTSSNRSDPGYSSGCDTCSVPSSNDGSDVACSEGICNHDGGSPHHSVNDLLPDSCLTCLELEQSSLSDAKHRSMHCRGEVDNQPGGFILTLQDMLEASCPSDEDDVISEEEIRRFRANQKTLAQKRQQLRQTLRQNFATLQQRGCVCQPSPTNGLSLSAARLSLNNQ